MLQKLALLPAIRLHGWTHWTARISFIYKRTSLSKVIWKEGRVAAKVWCTPNSPQKYPFPWTDPQTELRASSLDPSDLRCQTASGSDSPFFHNTLDRPMHRQNNRSSTGKFDDYRPLRL